MIRFLYWAAPKWLRRGNRGRGMTELLTREDGTRMSEAELVEAMADQLAEIRSLPELEARR